jgi:small nuclear ribonucleoprotein (snRNP)-like protein
MLLLYTRHKCPTKRNGEILQLLLFQVVVHMRDDTNAKGHLLYYHKHYNLALFRVQVDQPVQLPTLNDKLCCDQEIFELGRDEHLYVRIGHGRVKYSYDAFFGGYHCMGVVGGHEDFEVHFVLLH